MQLYGTTKTCTFDWAALAIIPQRQHLSAAKKRAWATPASDKIYQHTSLVAARWVFERVAIALPKRTTTPWNRLNENGGLFVITSLVIWSSIFSAKTSSKTIGYHSLDRNYKTARLHGYSDLLTVFIFTLFSFFWVLVLNIILYFLPFQFFDLILVFFTSVIFWILSVLHLTVFLFSVFLISFFF